MRELVVLTFVTLDGVMQAPGGPEEDTDGGFTAGGWSVPYWDEALEAAMAEQTQPPFDLILGRRTYEIFAAYWPNADDEMGRALNAATKHVASRTLEEVDWENSRLIAGDVAEAVRELKSQDGPELQVHGSSGLLQTLIASDLVDVFKVKTYPVTVGAGKRLFGEGAVPAAFELSEGQVSPSGVVLATYRRAGEVKTGTFGT
jgi:dihydrofolate reductase